MKTRLFRIIRAVLQILEEEFNLVFGIFSEIIGYLFIGYVLGNAFGTVLAFLKVPSGADMGVLFFLLIVFEKIGKFVYSSSESVQLEQHLKILNCGKNGILLGFFIDAFKVGS